MSNTTRHNRRRRSNLGLNRGHCLQGGTLLQHFNQMNHWAIQPCCPHIDRVVLIYRKIKESKILFPENSPYKSVREYIRYPPWSIQYSLDVTILKLYFVREFCARQNNLYLGYTPIFTKSIMAEFQTLNCRYSFGIQLMWPKFCKALVTQCMVYFHNKIWNHWAIYSYFGYIRRHYTPVALLL